MSAMYILREGLSGFRRAKLASAGSVITITISLMLLGLFYVIATNASRMIDTVREKVEMEAFLEPSITSQHINELQLQLSTLEGVEKVQFVSKDEAAKIFKREFGETIDSVLEFNPLPPSFKIFLKQQYRTTSNAEEVNKRVRALKGVDDVIYRKEMLEFIEKQTSILYIIALALGIFIGISAIFLVSNTIRLTIYAKRKTVQTMKLVGASRWFVRAPFLIEGSMQGLIGGAIAAGIIYYLLSFASKLISPDLAAFIRVDLFFYPIIVGSGILLGFFGSAVSVRRFIGETISG
jgi:cell division transport system permease protein